MPLLNDLVFLFTKHRILWLTDELSSALLIALLLIAAFFVRGARLAILRPLENKLLHLSRRPRLAIVSTGVLSLAVNAFISLCGRIPLPAVQDEFSYLLAADTFAHWRLTNPTPPLWIPLETFHVIFQPTYASKYPPGQGLMLAIGQVLTGHAFIGSWLGTMFACMAVCWMLYQWLPQRWALLGGVLCCVHPLMIYWTQSFWGCQWAIAGSALALGGVKNCLDKCYSGVQGSTPRSAVAGWAMGIGMSLMILTRPFEGGVLSLLLLAAAALMLYRKYQISWKSLVPVVACLAITIVFLGYYNFRVTGNAKVLPYEIHEKTYGHSPLFIWQDFRPLPHYHHAIIRDFHANDEAPPFIKHRTPQALVQAFADKMVRLLFLHSQLIAFLLALFALPWWLRRDSRLQLAALFLVLLIGALMLEVWFLPHYFTPLLPLAFILSLAGLRALRTWRWHGRRCGLFLVRATIMLGFLSVVSSYVRLADPQGEGIIYTSPGIRQFAAQKQQLAQQLGGIPGRHLVLVHYKANHQKGQEWVYNAADIEGARIIWARAMEAQQDRVLAEYYRQQGRTVWTLQADEEPPRLHRFN